MRFNTVLMDCSWFLHHYVFLKMLAKWWSWETSCTLSTSSWSFWKACPAHMFSTALVASLKNRRLKHCSKGQGSVAFVPLYSAMLQLQKGKKNLSWAFWEKRYAWGFFSLLYPTDEIWGKEKNILFLQTWGLLSHLGAAWHRDLSVWQLSSLLPNRPQLKGRKEVNTKNARNETFVSYSRVQAMAPKVNSLPHCRG